MSAWESSESVGSGVRRRSRTTRRGAGLLLAVLALLGIGLVAGAVPASAAGNGVTFTAVVNGRSLDSIGSNSPLVLHPDQDLTIAVSITNSTSATVDVRAVRLDGRVLNMSFFNYSTRIDRSIAPGATEQATFAVDISDLGSQATGLLPGRLALLNPNREVITEQSFPVDVKGPLDSAYGVFGIMVALITVLLLGAALARLALGTLPENRWYRATRFAVPGIGLGLTFTFTLSVFRALVPDGNAWLAFVVGGGLIGLAVGFFTPGPGGADDNRRPGTSDDEGQDDQDGPSAYPFTSAGADSPLQLDLRRTLGGDGSTPSNFRESGGGGAVGGPTVRG